MSEVIYPQLSGVNWPSYLLQAWLTLHHAGIPPQHIRFLPEVGHFAVPEVTEEAVEEDFERRSELAELRHPRGPQYDPQTGRVTVYQVDPRLVRPRLKVNVRADRRLQYGTNAQGEEIVLSDRQVGRLAHFMEPLMAGLPADAEMSPSPDMAGDRSATGDGSAELEDETAGGRAGRVEKPVARLTRQVCARYPELMATVPYAPRLLLGRWADALERALRAEDAPAQARFVEQAAQIAGEAEDRDALAAWFDLQAEKLPAPPDYAGDSIGFFAARARFREWSSALKAPTHSARQAEAAARIAGLPARDAAFQQAMFGGLKDRLAQETPRERYRVARELIEILTSEAFTSVAVLDYLWGMAWVHGRTEDFRLPVGALPVEGLFLSLTGGLNHRVLLLNMAQRWAQADGFLGVSASPSPKRALAAPSAPSQQASSAAPRPGPGVIGGQAAALSGGQAAGGLRSKSDGDKIGAIENDGEADAESFALEGDMTLFTQAEQTELWSLVTWRREATDPIFLLQIALQRLAHPDIAVERDGYLDTGGGFGTLFAQMGATASLGGMVQVHYPGIRIYVPLSEDADDTALAVKRRLNLLLRLFLPICLRADVVWQEAVARLGQGAYLRHPFQSGARLGQEAGPPPGAEPET